MYCKKCGKEIADTVKFCKFCGAEIKVKNTTNKSSSANSKKSSQGEASLFGSDLLAKSFESGKTELAKAKLEFEKKKAEREHELEKERLEYEKMKLEKTKQLEKEKKEKEKIRRTEKIEKREKKKVKKTRKYEVVNEPIKNEIEDMKEKAGTIAGCSIILGLLAGIVILFINFKSILPTDIQKNIPDNLLRILNSIKLPSYSYWFLLVLLIPLIIAGIMLLKAGAKKKGLEQQKKKWTKYLSQIDKNGNTNLDNLASKLNKSYINVCTDIQEMINLEFFIGDECDIEAYIDQETHLLVMSRDGKPLASQQSVQKKQKVVSKDLGPMQEYIDKIEEGIAYVKSKKDTVVKKYLEDIETAVRRIISKIEKNPELKTNQDIVKWENSSLPQTVKLIESYIGDDVSEKTAEEIRKMLETCAESFMSLDEKLSQSADMEILTDIEVLKSTFARDGLEKSDFDIEIDV